MYNINFDVIAQAAPQLIQGIKTTIFISVISSVCAFIIGLVIVFMRTMGGSLLKAIGAIYVEIIRNTPMLIQLYFVYKALPDLGLFLHPIACGIIALSLYTGAYISEVLRSGVNSVTSQQYEAARGLGLNKWQTFRLIIFPQAIRIVIPPLGSQFINLVKNSSLVSFIAVTDLFYFIYKGAVDDFRFFEFFIAGAFVYMTLTGIIAVIFNRIEKMFKLHGREARV
ncbi:MAG TPA: amino acid ABC transporter permease [Candidatus Gastranaerophilales bacterium]|nr:amino acid ABC transporter permease [Candidatus Gastranaerophilales bacterium]